MKLSINQLRRNNKLLKTDNLISEKLKSLSKLQNQ